MMMMVMMKDKNQTNAGERRKVCAYVGVGECVCEREGDEEKGEGMKNERDLRIDRKPTKLLRSSYSA